MVFKVLVLDFVVWVIPFRLHLYLIQAQIILNYQSMGNKGSSQSPNKRIFSKLLSTLPQSYIEVDKERGIFQDPQKPSLRTYIIMLNNDEQNNCVRSLNVRKKHPEELIQIMYGEMIQDQKEYKKIKVYVEYIIFNLQQFINVHFSDLMPIFYRAFKAFKLLYEQYGAFAPDPRMIGFNESAEVKVWAHVKYSKSKPQVSYQMYDEQKMVQSLIEIFSNKIDVNSLSLDSHKRKFNLEAKTFDEAIKLIESQVESIDLIPKKIKCISELLQSGRKVQENEIISMNSEYYNKSLEKTVKFKYSDPDPNAKSKPKINFTFNGYDGVKTPKNGSTSLPKVNFTASSPNKNVKFTAVSPVTANSSGITWNQNAESHLTMLQSRQTEKKQNNNETSGIKKENRSNSLVKFTYK